MIDGHTQLYGFYANPAKHSLSPLMHNLSFKTLGINATYLAFEIPEHFPQAAAAIRALDLGGINLSHPFKTAIIDYLDELTPTAQLLGAVNTVTNRNGYLIGDSTDGAGFIAGLAQHHQSVTAKTVSILGAGGAGLAVIAAVAQNKARCVHVFKRHNATFKHIVQRCQEISAATAVEIQVHAYEDQGVMQQILAQSDYLINTTNVGMGEEKDQMPVPMSVLATLTPTAIVCDLIYVPKATLFLQQAAALGHTCYNGLDMLIYQGALAFEAWTGEKMPVQQVTEALYQELYHTTENLREIEKI